jgi:hypothetical protein
MAWKDGFRKFLEADPERLHFAAHSHHFWPDVTFEAHQRAWLDAARLTDEKWDVVFAEVWPEAQRHIAKELSLPNPESIVFAPNTHELVLRLLSCLPGKPKVVTSDSEFHSFERQTRRLEEEGLLSKAERLHAEVAQAEAARQVRKADHDLALATSALANTLARDGELPLAGSPLFVVRSFGTLEDFVGKAREQNPALGRLAALRRLARQGTRAERGAFLPEVYVFGLRELHEDDLTILEPTWAAGVGARLALFTGGARLKRLAAATQREERVRSLARKADRDVATLVEQSWRRATNALDQFDTLAASRALARESVRVRTRAFEEGVGTSLEVVDAQLSLARVELERLAASYDFAVALADLLAASGEAGRFETLCAQAGGGVE